MKLKNIFTSGRRLKSQRHSVRIDFYCFGFFMSILMDNYWCNFFMFQTVRYVWVKRFLISILSCFFLPCLEQLLLWKYFMSHYKAVNINHPWLFKLGEWNNTHSVYPFLKFISGCRFTLKEYAKNVWGTRLRALKKLLRLYSMLMDMCLPIFDFWYLLNTVTPNCFKSNANSWCPDFFKKIVSCPIWNSLCST